MRLRRRALAFAASIPLSLALVFMAAKTEECAITESDLASGKAALCDPAFVAPSPADPEAVDAASFGETASRVFQRNEKLWAEVEGGGISPRVSPQQAKKKALDLFKQLGAASSDDEVVEVLLPLVESVARAGGVKVFGDNATGMRSSMRGTAERIVRSSYALAQRQSRAGEPNKQAVTRVLGLLPLVAKGSQLGFSIKDLKDLRGASLRATEEKLCQEPEIEAEIAEHQAFRALLDKAEKASGERLTPAQKSGARFVARAALGAMQQEAEALRTLQETKRKNAQADSVVATAQKFLRDQETLLRTVTVLGGFEKTGVSRATLGALGKKAGDSLSVFSARFAPEKLPEGLSGVNRQMVARRLELEGTAESLEFLQVRFQDLLRTRQRSEAPYPPAFPQGFFSDLKPDAAP